MNELSPDDTERILEAAAAGRSLEGHERLSELLVGLHSPDVPGDLGTAPAIGETGSGLILRMTRRTAVAASTPAVVAAATPATATGAAADTPPSLPSLACADASQGPGISSYSSRCLQAWTPMA